VSTDASGDDAQHVPLREALLEGQYSKATQSFLELSEVSAGTVVRLVRSIDSLRAAARALRSTRVCAVHAEWQYIDGDGHEVARPDRDSFENGSGATTATRLVPRIIGLATGSDVFVFDLRDLSGSQQRMIVSTIADIMADRAVLKVAFDLERELVQLAKSSQLSTSFRSCKNMLDIRSLWKALHRDEEDSSFRSITSCTFGKPVDESAAFSNWSKRPLKPDQVHYLGMHAILLLKVLDVCTPSGWMPSEFHPQSKAEAQVSKTIENLKFDAEAELRKPLENLLKTARTRKGNPPPRNQSSGGKVPVPRALKRTQGPGKRYSGRVKFFSPVGYGYIYVKDPGDAVPSEVFFFRKDIRVIPGRRPSLGVDEEVEFSVGINAKGNLAALDITAPGGGYITTYRRFRRNPVRQQNALRLHQLRVLYSHWGPWWMEISFNDQRSRTSETERAIARSLMTADAIEAMPEGMGVESVLGPPGSMCDIRLQPDEASRVISILGRKGLPDRAFELWQKLEERGLEPDVVTYNTLLDVCAKAKLWERALLILKVMEANCVKADAVSLTTAITACRRAGKTETALKLAKKMKAMGIEQSIVTRGEVLWSLAEEGKDKAALDYLQEMQEEGVSPDMHCYDAASMACAKSGNWEGAVGILNEVLGKNRLLSKRNMDNLFFNVLSTLLDAQELEKAEELIRIMRSYHVSIRKLQTYDVALRICEFGGMSQLAVELIQDMRRSPYIRPDTRTYTHAISACGKEWKWEQALELLWVMREDGVPVNAYTYCALITACGNAGKMDVVKDLLQTIEKEDVRADKAVYNSALAACRKSGAYKEAVSIFNLMQSKRLDSSSYSFNLCISTLVKANELSYAEAMFGKVDSYGIQPDTISYNIMMSGYLAAGDWKSLLQLMNQLQKTGLSPDSVTIGLVFKACELGGKWDYANRILRSVQMRKILDPEEISEWRIRIAMASPAGFDPFLS